MKSPITIREVSTAEELKQAQEIRVRVLEEEQGFPRDDDLGYIVERLNDYDLAYLRPND